jgi:LuxR family maltose regulon positive regulatory protein
MLSDLIEHTPGDRRWIIATRDPLALPITSWFAYGLAASTITELDLRLTFNEAQQVATKMDAKLERAELHSLFALTQAWPTAFAFAIRASARTADLKRVASGTRDMIYQFLAEQVLQQLEPETREFLLDTALLPVLRPQQLEAAGYNNATLMTDLVRRRTAFVSLEDDGVFRYHDLFRDFLSHELQLRGLAYYVEKCVSAATLAMRTGHISHALDLYIRSGSIAHIVALVSTSGLDLFDAGHSELLARALQAVPAEQRTKEPVIATVAASIHNAQLRLDEAEALYCHALSIAHDSQLRATIALRYAGMLMSCHQRYSDALAVLERVSEDEIGSDHLRPYFFGRKAAALSFLGFPDEADRLMDRAFFAARILGDELTDLRTLQAGAIVAQNNGRSADACTLARKLTALAEESGYSAFISGAGTVYLTAAYNLGDYAECHKALAEVRGDSKRLNRTYAFICDAVEYSLAAERGDEARMLELDESWHRENVGFPATYFGLAYARGFPMAWLGHFKEAYALIAGLYAGPCPLEDKALAAAHRLLYAGAAGLRSAADAAAVEARDAINNLGCEATDSFRGCRASIIAAIGELLIGHNGTCHNLLALLEKRKAQMPSALAHMLRCAREMYIQVETGRNETELARALEKLRQSPLGAYARIFEVAPLPRLPKKPPFAALTKTELQVLKILNQGVTSRQAAAQLGRSAMTIDAHVKSIARKLGCRGRREALALAQACGIV